LQPLAPGAAVLRGFATPYQAALLGGVDDVTAQSPLRHMVTPGGFHMSVAMTNCGALGWVTDRRGYRYDRLDPESGKPWPAMPASFLQVAAEAATQVGFDRFVPDACLINRYEAGNRLSLHQDKNERDFNAPIVSVSLGIPAVFLFGGSNRTDQTTRVMLTHGDVVVWGGPARLRYHPLVGDHRINLAARPSPWDAARTRSQRE
jgi:DNA oxidative demethylase